MFGILGRWAKGVENYENINPRLSIYCLHSQISSALGHPWKLEQRNLLVEKTDGSTHSLKNRFLI